MGLGGHSHCQGHFNSAQHSLPDKARAHAPMSVEELTRPPSFGTQQKRPARPTAASGVRQKRSQALQPGLAITLWPRPLPTQVDVRQAAERRILPADKAAFFGCQEDRHRRDIRLLPMPGLPRHSIIRSKLRMTRSASSEKSISIPRPSRLKSSSTFNNRNVPQSPRRSAMKSINQVMLGASGTANASGLSRFNRLRGLMRRFSSSAQ